ncbi:disintegrin and metalloproteinase domain-containing protein 1a-like [Pteronotus mesoamericanus]|uniref:disintegrin and metalloproteinase domain-containing protein 1a-like n=1 Tax=Pteronotus mesoamericanus TaxID=1884717 RepID=UPI0023EAC5A8|nr:disintegrin and metalloproteinase domain-containing protein 1a-like [Pteronotus parnellii mesoamericanus]
MCETRRVFQIRAPQMRGVRLVLVPGPSCARLGIVLVLVLGFLPSFYCALGSERYSSYEIVTPKALTAEGREDPVGKVSYVMFMQGQKQLIHLKAKTGYFVSNFPVFSYHNGILEQETPLTSHDCHYEGYIEGVPGSFVSVNTCSGLRGILIKEGQSYGIEPMASSKRYEHVLYTTARQARASCSVTSKDSRVVSTSRQQGSRTPGGPQALSHLWSHAKYVEMFVVVNNRRFEMWGSNVSETVQRVMDIIALANSFTRGINTEVVLAGMEIWTEGDLTEVPVDLQVALRNFNSWRQEKLLHRAKHDVAHMIVGQHPEQGMGQAFLNGACTSGFAAAVESFHHEDVLLFAALMVHELGHNLGIQHDHSACICRENRFCLMYENITKESGFSNCSSDYFYRFLQEHKGACLFNNPRHKGRSRRASSCGNGVVEDDEQCDCGSNCDTNVCCDQTCHFKNNAVCDLGPCCNSSCQFAAEGFNCRPAVGECDLPEYCSGTSAVCPPNSYKQDGTPCGENYCVNSVCGDPNYQCRLYFGSYATSAPHECYEMINSKGNRFGNCGLPNSSNPSYVQCTNENILCGKIACINVETLPDIQPFHTLIQIPHENNFCWTMDAYNVTDIPDNGDVHYGTSCAPNKICIDYSCTDYAVLNYDCNPAEMCSGRGVCNNLRHCHCEAGYAPPNCKSIGDGGSVDSGPPGKPENPDDSGNDETGQSVKHEKILDKMILSFFILFLIILAVVTICMCLICKSQKAEPIEKGLEEEAGKPPEVEPQLAGPQEAAPEEAKVEEKEVKDEREEGEGHEKEEEEEP